MHCHYCYDKYDHCEHQVTAPVIYRCKEDAISNEYNTMLYTLYSVLIDEHHFDLDDLKIIQILADYSLGAVVCCSKNDCQNEICLDYEVQFDFGMICAKCTIESIDSRYWDNNDDLPADLKKESKIDN